MPNWSEVIDLFFGAPDVTVGILGEISKEDVVLAWLRTSVERALHWSETQNHPDARTCFADLDREIRMMILNIELMTETEALAIEQQFYAGDYSWFRSDGFRSRFQGCEDLLR